MGGTYFFRSAFSAYDRYNFPNHPVFKLLCLNLIHLMFFYLNRVVWHLFAKIHIMPYLDPPFPVHSNHFLANFKIPEKFIQFLKPREDSKKQIDKLTLLKSLDLHLMQPNWNPLDINHSRSTTAADIYL